MKTFGRIGSAEKNILKQSAASLVGIAQGMLCDGKLSDDEILFLDKWFKHNAEIASTWPGEAILARVRDTLADGIITPSERDYLVDMLQKLIGGDDPVGFDAHVSELALDRSVEVCISGACFCFTGDFAYGSRSYCQEVTEKLGGLIKGNISKQVDYVVVGGLGSSEWKHGSYGTKIEKAMEYKKLGIPLRLVHESQWVRAIGF